MRELSIGKIKKGITMRDKIAWELLAISIVLVLVLVTSCMTPCIAVHNPSTNNSSFGDTFTSENITALLHHSMPIDNDMRFENNEERDDCEGVNNGDSPEDAPSIKNITTQSIKTTSLSENVKKFRTDTAPELDWYQPCDGGDNLINFYINVADVETSNIKSATLTLSVYDVDIPGSSGCGPEIDQVYFNGHYLGTLTGANSQWSTCTFTVNPSYIIEGANSVKIYIDTTGSGCWCVECDWGELTVEVTETAKTPWILVHGWKGDPTNWKTFEKFLQDNDIIYRTVKLSDGPPEKRADELDKKIEDMHWDKFNIVAHSQGGLDARAYIHKRKEDKKKTNVKNLVMIGTPNHGSAMAHFIPLYTWGRWLTPGNVERFNRKTSNVKGVDY